ncbi:MAG: hypothetical protein EHJ94_10655 [Deltaproteobacteria bacterium]|nr:MAG: hypothetical protein EHJ94_10655 [Deltaproteobacteria bacterium]
MNSPEIKNFIQKNETLFWDIGQANKANLTPEALMETVLNYGDIITIKHFFDLIGLEKAAEIFHNTPERRKNNYLPLVRNFFTLYFKRHVQRNIN